MKELFIADLRFPVSGYNELPTLVKESCYHIGIFHRWTRELLVSKLYSGNFDSK